MATAQAQAMTGRKLVRLLEYAARLCDIAQREIFLKREWIDDASHTAVGQERLQLGTKEQGSIVEEGVVQRLYAKPVACHEERLPVTVPQRKGEHASKALDAVDAPRLPRVDDDFRVTAGAKHMPERLQLGHQLPVVVNLAVEDDDHRSVLVEKRLLATGDVDDRQPAVAQTQSRLDMQAALVRTAVQLRVIHALESRAVDLGQAAGIKDSGNSAHGIYRANCPPRARSSCRS